MSLFYIDENLISVATDLAGFDDDLNNTREALERVVRNVIIPAFAENFTSGGRPAWTPLSEDTVAQKGSDEPLIKTGRLYSGSQAFSGWNISNDEAEFTGAAGADYGKYHQFGTRKMPERPWATVTVQDEEKAEEVMVEWIGERLGDHGFSVFTSSFGSGDF